MPLLAGGESKDGYPLIRFTIDECLKLLTFWRYKLKIGRVVELWLIRGRDTGWVKVGFSAMAVVCTGYGAYHGTGVVYRRGTEIYGRLTTPASGNEQNSAMAAGPQIISHDIVEGNRLRLHWTSAGPDMRYRVYYHPAGSDFDEPVGQDVSTLGVDVDINPTWKKAFITVTAIAFNGHESPHSPPIMFVLKPENQSNSVTPLEEGIQTNGTSANEGGRLPAGRQGHREHLLAAPLDCPVFSG